MPRLARWPFVLAALLLTATLGAAFLSEPRQPVAASSSECPGLEVYEPRLRALSVAELERQVAALPYLMPSAAKNQLRTLQASTLTFAEDKRACMYRMSLIGTVASIPTVFAAAPGLFGHTSTSAQLRGWFLELPLRQAWTTEQRASILEQIDTLFLPNLKVEEPGDAEFWKRQYYGIALTCEATDLTLEKLKARRTTDCLNLQPK